MNGLHWIAIDPAIAEDPKVIEIAHALKKDRYHIAGRFPAFLGSVARHAPDGNLSPFSPAVLDSWAGGLRGFGRQVRASMCDESGRLTAWEKFNGKKLTSLQIKREKVALWREEKRGTVPGQKGNGAPAVPERIPLSSALTDTGTGTVTEKLKTKESPPPAPNESGLQRHLPESCWAYLRIVLMRAQEGAPAVALSIFQRIGLDPKAIPNGPGGMFCTADEMAEVLKVVAGSKGTGWSERFVHGILVKLRQQPTGQTPGERAFEVIGRAFADDAA